MRKRRANSFGRANPLPCTQGRGQGEGTAMSQPAYLANWRIDPLTPTPLLPRSLNVVSRGDFRICREVHGDQNEFKATYNCSIRAASVPIIKKYAGKPHIIGILLERGRSGVEGRVCRLYGLPWNVENELVEVLVVVDTLHSDAHAAHRFSRLLVALEWFSQQCWKCPVKSLSTAKVVQPK